MPLCAVHALAHERAQYRQGEEKQKFRNRFYGGGCGGGGGGGSGGLKCQICLFNF